MPHFCVSEPGLPIRRQAIIWINAELSLIEPLRIKFSEIWIEIFFIKENTSEQVVCILYYKYFQMDSRSWKKIQYYSCGICFFFFISID